MKLLEVLQSTNDQLSDAKKHITKVRRILNAARKKGDHETVEDAESALDDALQQLAQLKAATKKPVVESTESNATDTITALDNHVSKFLLKNAQHDWQQNRARHERNNYHSFEEWFRSDFMGNSYNVDSVIDNVASTLKARVIERLNTSV